MSDFIRGLAEVVPPHLQKRVQEELIRGWRQEEVKMRAVAKQAGHFDRFNENKAIEGVGQKIASIPVQAWHYWGQRLGYECWEDKTFLREFLRDNPETAVKNYAKKACVNGAIFTADGYITK